jgi:RNA polymerase sigma-70 factor (ECF subfamily)
VLRLLLGLERKRKEARVEARVVPVNGEPALLFYHEGQLVTTLSFASDGQRVCAVFSMRNPEKLRRVAAGAVTIA